MAEERVQRRLAAIMAADVAGYSRLIRDDEEGTLHRLKDCLTGVIEPNLARYGGRIVKTMGDGVLVEFSSAVDAVKSALEIQTAMIERNASLGEFERMKFRLGVNLGDVVVDGDDIHGDGVNVAARLEGISEPGGICISGKVYEEVRDRIEVTLEDLGEREVKNINRPVRVWRWSPSPTRAPAASPAELNLPDKPSIAVLPFDNLSGDPEQEYFADGTTEDIITDLSKISGLFVIARNSSFAYKGQTPDLRVVGRELGVRHILEGSVRRAGEQVRINAQLVDTQTGGHIWAERYDGSFNNIFALQDEITGKIVSALKISLTTGERARAEIIPTEDMEAYDLFLRGRAAILPPSRDGNARARELLEQAVERDPKFAEAHALLGYSYFHSSAFMWADEPGKDKALETAKKGVELDESSALAHARYGWLCCVCGDYDLAVAELERAIELDPNDADSYHWLGETLNYMGEPEKALEIIKTGMRLSPHLHGAHLGNSKYLLRQFDDAITALNEGKIRAPGFPTNYIYLAVVYAELGREVEARAEIANVLEIVPSLTIQCMREKWPWFKNKIDADRFVAGLRKAGLPEE